MELLVLRGQFYESVVDVDRSVPSQVTNLEHCRGSQRGASSQ